MEFFVGIIPFIVSFDASWIVAKQASWTPGRPANALTCPWWHRGTELA